MPTLCSNFSSCLSFYNDFIPQASSFFDNSTLLIYGIETEDKSGGKNRKRGNGKGKYGQGIIFNPRPYDERFYSQDKYLTLSQGTLCF